MNFTSGLPRSVIRWQRRGTAVGVVLLAVSLGSTAGAQVLDDLVDTRVFGRRLESVVAAKSVQFGLDVPGPLATYTGIAVEARSESSEVEVLVRFPEDTGPGPWRAMHVVRSATSDALVAGYRDSVRPRETGFEIRVVVPEGYAVDIGSVGTFDERLDADGLPPDSVLEPLPAAPGGSVVPPDLITRQEWGAEPFRGTPSPLANPSYDYMTFHHAAGFSATSLDEGIAQLRAIQDLHQNVRGWSDIGYQFVIDRGGRLYQGRPFLTAASGLDDLPVLALGAHAGGANTGNVGICLLGCYHPPEGSYCQDEITPEAYDTYVTLFAFLSERYGIGADRIRGHRDFSSTACPGDNNYALLPVLIADTNELLLTGNAGLGLAELLALVTNDGVVMLTMLLTEDRGIRAYRLERWIGGEVTVLFDGLPDLPDTWADDDLLPPGPVEYRLYALGAGDRSEELGRVGFLSSLPTRLVLSESFPNPASDQIRIRYFLAQAGDVSLALYDVTGRRVRGLASGYHDADTWFAVATPTDQLPAGVYYYRIQVRGSGGIAQDAIRPIIVIH